MEKLARTAQIRLGSVLGNVKKLRHFANSCTEPIVQSQSRLVDIGKRSNAVGKDVIALRHFSLPVRSRLPSRRPVKNLLVRVWISEANPRFQVHSLVERDPVDPGGEFGLAAKRLDRVVNLEKYLLRHVFRLWNELLAQNRNREAKHESAMPTNQFRESLLVAALRAGHELGIALHQALTPRLALEEMKGYQARAQKSERQGRYPKSMGLRVKSPIEHNHDSKGQA
jgi:hypothetical protein